MLRVILNSIILVILGSVILGVVGYLAGITDKGFYTVYGLITGALIAITYTIPGIEKK